MMEGVRESPMDYGMDEGRVRQFERLLVTMDQAVLSGTIFLSCIEQVSYRRKSNSSSSSNRRR